MVLVAARDLGTSCRSAPHTLTRTEPAPAPAPALCCRIPTQHLPCAAADALFLDNNARASAGLFAEALSVSSV